MRNGLLKSIFIANLVWFLTVATASGQKRLNFRTVEFGAGPAMVSLHDNDPLINSIAKPSFAASGGLTYSLKRNLYIATHVMYEHKGGKSIQNFRDAEIAPVKYNTTSSYITSTVGVRQYLADGGVFLEAGPFIAFLLGSKTTRISGGSPLRDRNYATIDAGASLSVGYTPRRTEYNGFSLRLVNNVGMTDIDLRTGTKEWTNSLALILGMRIQMN